MPRSLNSTVNSQQIRSTSEPLQHVNKNYAMQHGIQKARSIYQFEKIDKRLNSHKDNWANKERKKVDKQYFSKTKLVDNKTVNKTTDDIQKDWSTVMGNARQACGNIYRDIKNCENYYKGRWAEDLAHYGMIGKDQNPDHIKAMSKNEQKDMFGRKHSMGLDRKTIDTARKKYNESYGNRHNLIKKGVNADNLDGFKNQRSGWGRLKQRVKNAYYYLTGKEQQSDIFGTSMTAYKNSLKDYKKQSNPGWSWQAFRVGFWRMTGFYKDWVAKQDFKVYQNDIYRAADHLETGALGGNFRAEMAKIGQEALDKQQGYLKSIDDPKKREEAENEIIHRALIGKVVGFMREDSKNSDSPFNTPRMKSLSQFNDQVKSKNYLAEAIVAALVAKQYDKHVGQKAEVIDAEISTIRARFGEFDELRLSGKENVGKHSTVGIMERLEQEDRRCATVHQQA